MKGLRTSRSPPSGRNIAPDVDGGRDEFAGFRNGPQVRYVELAVTICAS